MKVAVTVAALNEEKLVGQFIKAVLNQTFSPNEIIFVDDGSTDRTGEIVKSYAKKYERIKYIYQKNTGPAKARNRAWQTAKADICAFTDADCIPETNWLEELLKPLRDPQVGATAGTYKTLNEENLLAKFIGLEIARKYRNIKGEVEAHGTYNLAVRKKVLEETGGMNEEYPKPSGEDWDLTYKISRKYRIIYVPTAIVETEHFENLWLYMKNQVRRGFDRIKLYNDNPDYSSADVYTSRLIKYQVWIAGLSLPALLLFFPFFRFSFIIPIFLLWFLLVTSLINFPYIAKRDLKAALYGIVVQLLRNYAWFFGMIKGIYKFGFIKIIVGVLKSGM